MLRDRHFKIHHENDQELLNQSIDESKLTVKCTECDLKFLEERFMRFHKKYKHDSEFGAGILKYNCHKCEKKFPTLSSESIHEGRVHGTSKYLKDGMYRCPLCYCKYEKLLTLVDHHFRYQHKSDVELMNRTIEDHELTINCTHCDLKFTEERFMEYHKQLEHFKNLGSRVQTTHCTLCDVEFRDNYNYHIHKNQIHKKEYDLFKMKTETLEFKFECILCPKAISCILIFDIPLGNIP